MRSRGGWVLLDQVASSLSNYALFISVARSAGAAGLGAFSIAYGTYFVVLGVIRAASSDALTVRFSSSPRDVLERAAQATTGVSLLGGIVVGAAIVVAGALAGGPVGGPLIALGAVLGGLMVQDACRFVFFAGKQPARAFVVDATWLAVQGALLGVLYAAGHPSVTAQVLAWGAAGTLAGAVGLALLRVTPNLAATRLWLRDHRDLAAPFSGEFLVDRGSSQLGFMLVAAAGGLGPLGALSGARALFAPVTTVLSGAGAFGVTEGARLDPQRSSLRRFVLIFAVALAALPLALAAVLLLGPDALGRLLVGRTWPDARRVVFPVAVFSAVLAASLGPWVGLRVRQAATTSLAVKLAIAPVSVAAPAAGYALGGVQGAAWGLVTSGVVALLLLVGVFLRQTAAGATAATGVHPVAGPQLGSPTGQADPPGPKEQTVPMPSTEDDRRGPDHQTAANDAASGGDLARRADARFAALLGTHDGPAPSEIPDPPAAEATTPGPAPDDGARWVEIATQVESLTAMVAGVADRIGSIESRLETLEAGAVQLPSAGARADLGDPADRGRAVGL